MILQTLTQRIRILHHPPRPIQRFNFSSGDIRSLIPGFGEREECGVPFFIHSPTPILLRLLRSLDSSDFVCQNFLHHLLHKLRLKLRTTRSIRKRRRRLRSIEEKHIRKPGNSNPHRSPRSIPPMMRDSFIMHISNIQLRERTRHGIESRREN